MLQVVADRMLEETCVCVRPSWHPGSTPRSNICLQRFIKVRSRFVIQEMEVPYFGTPLLPTSCLNVLHTGVLFYYGQTNGKVEL